MGIRGPPQTVCPFPATLNAVSERAEIWFHRNVSALAAARTGVSGCLPEWAWLVVTLLEEDQAPSPLSVILHLTFIQYQVAPRVLPPPGRTLMQLSR